MTRYNNWAKFVCGEPNWGSSRRSPDP